MNRQIMLAVFIAACGMFISSCGSELEGASCSVESTGPYSGVSGEGNGFQARLSIEVSDKLYDRIVETRENGGYEAAVTAQFRLYDWDGDEIPLPPYDNGTLGYTTPSHVVYLSNNPDGTREWYGSANSAQSLFNASECDIQIVGVWRTGSDWWSSEPLLVLFEG